MTETLHTCPACQRHGFTLSGLKRHVCRNPVLSSFETMSNTALAAPQTIDIEPAAQTPSVAWSKAKRYVELTSLHLAASCAAQVLAGIELLALKAHYPETRGRKSFHDGRNFDARTWEQAVKAELGVAQNTAWRWMEMGKVAKKRLAKDHTDLAALLDQPPSALTEAERDALKRAVHKITDGQTQTELMLEWGITKAPQGSAAKGGNTRALPAAPTATEQAAAAGEPVPEGAEPDGWEARARHLNGLIVEALGDGWWNECLKARRAELAGNLLDAYRAVAATLDEAPKA